MTHSNRNGNVSHSKKLAPIELPARMTVAGLADILQQNPIDVIKVLMRMGHLLNINAEVKFDLAAKTAAQFDVPVLNPAQKEESGASVKVAIDETLTDENSQSRPPIVTIMGHVDHGKTTLLDVIRGAKLADSEVGGITQQIGAYQVEHNGKAITFIDTPGHEAFTAMRVRGTQVTDIAVLVVAANDGVMPQTIEAIDHSKAANVPILVAVNKIDLPNADIYKVHTELSKHGVVVEEFGGDVVSVPISAKNKQGIENLLEAILLVSEIEEIKTNPSRPGLGVIIESRVDRLRGNVATAIIKGGFVKVGDHVVAGLQKGKVRMMVNGYGKKTKSAGPSEAVEILGLGGLASPGDQLEVVEDERAARDLVDARLKMVAKRGASSVHQLTRDEAVRMMRASAAKADSMNLIIKTGLQGSVDAVRRVVEGISTTDMVVNVLRSASGGVNESDVMLASASDAVIVAFGAEIEEGAYHQSKSLGIVIKSFDVIYRLVEGIRESIEGRIKPEIEMVNIGSAIVREVFPRGRHDRIAGIHVTKGSLNRRKTVISVVRNGKTIYDGRISSMKHLKENVNVLNENFEGGIMLSSFNDFHEGDVLDAFEEREVSRVSQRRE